MVVLRHSARINGLTGIAITKLDVLDSIKTLKICTSYKHKGKIYKEFPKEIGIIEGCTPLYEEVKGWSTSTVGITDFAKLPHTAKAYIRKIQSLLGVEIQLISTGQKRDEIIQIKNPF
jgi:adenylosuccinate synthase